MSAQLKIDSFNLDEPHNVDVGKKHQAWTLDDDRMLVKVWILFPVLLKIGKMKKEFWQRICDYLNRHKKSGPQRICAAINDISFGCNHR